MITYKEVSRMKRRFYVSRDGGWVQAKYPIDPVIRLQHPSITISQYTYPHELYF
jgi:hypothetical protein